MILLSIILTISKRQLEKNSFEILPGSGIEIRGCPLGPTYRYILYWLSDKLTSKRTSWNYAKLTSRQVLSKTVCQPLQVPRTLCCFFSFHQFEWNEHTKDDELELFWIINKFWMQIYTKPEYYWSCIAHMSAENYVELEQTWKYSSTQCCISFHPCRNIWKQIWPCHKIKIVKSTQGHHMKYC